MATIMKTDTLVKGSRVLQGSVGGHELLDPLALEGDGDLLVAAMHQAGHHHPSAEGRVEDPVTGKVLLASGVFRSDTFTIPAFTLSRAWPYGPATGLSQRERRSRLPLSPLPTLS